MRVSPPLGVGIAVFRDRKTKRGTTLVTQNLTNRHVTLSRIRSTDTIFCWNTRSDVNHTYKAIIMTSSSSYDTSVLKTRISHLISSSSLPLSSARRWALLESCDKATSKRELLDMVLDCVVDSKHLPATTKDPLVDALLANDWDTVASIVQGTTSNDFGRDNMAFGLSSFQGFRRMALTLFYDSRKIQSLPLHDRRQIGSAVLRTRTREELMHLFLTRLTSAKSLDDAARAKVANDVYENRFYRLLRPDRLDCRDRGPTYNTDNTDSSARADTGPFVATTRGHGVSAAAVSNNNHDDDDDISDECPICLTTLERPTRLACSHVYCRDCVVDWARQQNAAAAETTRRRRGALGRNRNRGKDLRNVSCPMCRQEDSLEMLS